MFRNYVALLFIAITILLCTFNSDTFTGTAHSIIAICITLPNMFPRCRKKFNIILCQKVKVVADKQQYTVINADQARV